MMKPFSLKSIRNILVFIVLAGSATSCVFNKDAVYLQQKEGYRDRYESIYKEPTIQRNDELYVRVGSLDQGGFNFFATNEGAMYRTPGNDVTLVSFAVNDSGNLNLPYVGVIHVEGLTLRQAELFLEQSLAGYLNQPSVSLDFVVKTVSIMGEVRVPGRYDFQKDKLNIMQAIARAGDVTYYGNRGKVLVLREVNGEVQRISIDLLNENAIISEGYYLQDDDVVYVEPFKRHVFGFQEMPWALIISSATLGLVILGFMRDGAWHDQQY